MGGRKKEDKGQQVEENEDKEKEWDLDKGKNKQKTGRKEKRVGQCNNSGSKRGHVLVNRWSYGK